jgi:hypothetical protein
MIRVQDQTGQFTVVPSPSNRHGAHDFGDSRLQTGGAQRRCDHRYQKTPQFCFPGRRSATVVSVQMHAKEVLEHGNSVTRQGP